MDAPEQIAAFEADLNRLVDRYRREFDLTYASSIGVLYLKVASLSLEALRRADDETADPSTCLDS